MNAPLLAGAAGACLVAAVVLVVAGLRRCDDARGLAVLRPRWQQNVLQMRTALSGGSGSAPTPRRRALVSVAAGVAVWVVTGWPVAALAAVLTGTGLPWLLGAHQIVRRRLETLQALESWCRRMADTLAGGGAVGLAEAIALTADDTDEAIRPATTRLSRALRQHGHDPATALRGFADHIDDRAGDTVAAALHLALWQQSSGIAEVLRQLADGIARDIRARRDIEAARAESRQSIRTLLLIQAGVLVMLAVNPAFAAPYSTPVGQVVMAALLAGTAGLLVWMRRLSLGSPAPRFLTDPATGAGSGG